MALLSELIRHDKPTSTGATAVYPYSAAIERQYKFTSRFGDEVLLHRVDKKNKTIHLPRGLCPVSVNDNRADGEVVIFPKGPTPRDNQVEMFDETAAVVQAGLSGVLVAYTGFGKTVLGYHAAFVAQRKTIVITTKEDIYDQWVAGAQKFLGLQPHEIGEVRGDKCEVIGTKFVVAMIQSLAKSEKYPDWVFQDFGLAIFDECHRVPAEQFSNAIWMIPARIRLGLSATPDRADGKETVVYAHIGPIRAKTEAELMVPKALIYTSAWDCPRVIRTDKKTGEKKVVRMPHQPGKTAHIEKIVAADPVRNHLLAEIMYEVRAKNRQLVVFSNTHDHLRSIHRAAHEVFGISGKEMGYYLGATTKAEKAAREREKGKPLLLTTYVMMGEGTSLDWLDSCLLAMPRSNVNQPVGRIRREYPDKLAPVVIDVADHDSPVFSATPLPAAVGTKASAAPSLICNAIRRIEWL
jgi:superfamily II DNA or RNA helicase